MPRAGAPSRSSEGRNAKHPYTLSRPETPNIPKPFTSVHPKPYTQNPKPKTPKPKTMSKAQKTLNKTAKGPSWSLHLLQTPLSRSFLRGLRVYARVSE